MNGRLPALLTLSLCAACANYDFAAARLPNGQLDRQKLIQDLRSSGRSELSQGLWIPLLYMDLTRFAPSRPGLPDGYTLREVRSYGPLFLAGRNSRQVMDEQGASVEGDEWSWAGWGVLWQSADQRIETPFGVRHRERRKLLLLGPDETTYVKPQPPAGG